MSVLDTGAELQHNDHPLTLHNVPVHLTSLVGREREVAAICDLLRRDDIRLVTLTGPGGIGKTRLGIEAASRLLESFADGTYFVNLAPITDSGAVAQTMAAALGIRQIGEQSLEENLSRYLSKKQVLLLLDNFEQVLAAGLTVTQLLKVAPRLKVLVTSRELLSLSGEHDFPVPPLALPPVLTPQGDTGRYARLSAARLADYESVQLFARRATAYKPDFILNEENAYIIAAICRKLDGLPLAIELAAPRIRYLPLEAIFDRLQDRLGLLTGGARDLPLRQRTLRGTIEWSYGLLSEEEKRLFSRLGAFRGSRSLEAIEAVCNFDRLLGIEPLDGVASLVDKSLLQQATDTVESDSVTPRTQRALEAAAQPRFVMLETLQEYAKERLEESGQAEALYDAHATYFTELVERAEPELHGPQQLEWLDLLESEQDNLREALDWAYRNDLAMGLRLVAALNIYWNRRGYLIEGREWASKVVSRVRENDSQEGTITRQGGYPVSMARALYTLGIIAFRQANYHSAHDFLEESIFIFQQVQARGERGDTRGLAESLNVLGIVKNRLENMQARRALHEKALELGRQVGDNWSIARSLYQLGHVARLTGEYETGRLLFQESLELFKELGDKFNIGLAYIGLGQMAERQEDYQEARRLFEEALSIFKELGDTWGISGALFCLGGIHIGLKDYESARTALEDNLALTEILGTGGDAAEALEKLGKVAYYQGDYVRACDLYKRSLSLLKALEDKMWITRCLIDLAGVMASASKDDVLQTSAARLLGAAQELMDSVGFQLEPEDGELCSGYITTVRDQLGELAFDKAWAEGQAMDIDEAVSYAQALPLLEQLDIPLPSTVERPPSKTDFGGLTRREREIAALVTSGKTNRQIADELVVSERTVEGHINNILSKLGFRSRAQISAWAVTKGLAGDQ